MLARHYVCAPFVRLLLVAITLVIAGATASSVEAASSSGTVFRDVSGSGVFSDISISGVAFDDINGNGTQDPGEPGLAGVTIQLDIGANGSVDATTVTDVSGSYSFTNLGPGTYRVRQVVPAGRIQTSANPADIVASSGNNVSGVAFGSIVSAANGSVPTLDPSLLLLLAVAMAAIAAVRMTR